MRRRFFWSMLGVAGVALFVVAVLGAVAGQISTARTARAEITRQAEAVAALIRENAVQQEERLGARALLELLRRGAVLEGDDRFVRLLTAAQEVTGGSLVDLGWVGGDGRLRLLRNADLGSTLGFDARRLVAGEDVYSRVTVGEDGRSVLAVAHPFRVAGRGPIKPVVVVAQPSDRIDWRGTLRGLLVPLLIAAGLSAVAARWLSGWLGARLSDLAAAARRIAGGERDARADEGGDDEIGAVARSFNAMADELLAAQRREREFLLSVGHDLRTPLTTIGGYAEVLDDGGLEEVESRRIAGVLGRETQRLRRLVDDLMLLARLEAREFTLRKEPVDVAAHLRELAETFAPRAEDAGVNLIVAIEPSGSMVTDPDRISQIASNLLENALRYTPEAGDVEFRVRRVQDGIELEVTDTGPGIDSEDLPHVFDRFYVAGKYRRARPEGSGLGLSIVQQLVTLLGGTIQADSKPGRGSRFRVWIPAAG